MKTTAMLTSLIAIIALAGCGAQKPDAKYTPDKPYDTKVFYMNLNDGRIIPCWKTPYGNAVCDFTHPKYENSEARDEWLKQNTSDLKNEIEGLGLSLQDLFTKN